MAAGILASYDKRQISEFKKDLLEMLRICKWMDKSYANSSQDYSLYKKKFEALISSFNKKYKNLALTLVEKTNEVELKMFLNEKNVKEAFANSASKISGLQSVGANTFGAATTSSQELFAQELDRVKDKLYVAYYDPEAGKTNLFFKHDKKSKKVQLVYDDDIENEPSAEFQTAAYYALGSYNKKINLHDEATTLGFSSIPDHGVKADYFRKFDPHISE